MKINKKIFLGVFFVLVVLLAVIISVEAFSSTNPQFLSPGASSFSSLRDQNINVFPVFNEQLCEAGQDFILQVAPFGCEPSVVRSDLLEEQDVPVFCQISATNINPLIDVKVIDSIIFSGQYSRDVAGVGFYPAKAAVRSSRNTLLNSPVLGNIGYAVIVLRQNPNESSMPDFVEGNLTADIRYDIENAFGVGQAQYYLPLFDDNEWENKHQQYGFWDGNGFLRAEVIDENGAVISVYLDKENIISSFNLEKGQTSGQIYLPGFYCKTGLRLKLNSLENPDTRAKFDINGDIVEVADEEKFLENKCQVKNIDNQGLSQKVEISCRTDYGGDSFSLTIAPRVKLEFPNKKEEGYTLGEKLPFSDDPNKDVYLGYIGTNGDSGKKEDLYVIFAQVPRSSFGDNKLTNQMLSEIARYNGDRLSAQKGGFFAKVFSVAAKASASWMERFSRYLVQGTEIRGILEYGQEGDVYGTSVNVLGLAGPKDSIIEEESKENYENAMADYRTIINEFFGEIEGLSSSGKEITFGEVALINSIQLSNFVNQKKTLSELCKEFGESYPESDQKPSICESELKLSNSEAAEHGVVINGKTKIISFEGIYEPDYDEYGVDITISNAGSYSGSLPLRQNGRADFSESEFLELKELNEDYALFDVSSVAEITGRELFWKTNSLRINLNDFKVVGKNNYQISVDKINLEKVAKVSVLPNIKYAGTEANISFKIGIEKRAIQLSPDKIKEKLENLNESIEKWESTSETLGDVVRGFNGMCLATGAMLTAKNYFENLDGKSIARQQVMRSDGGWTDICSDEIKETGKSLDSCFLDHSKEIDADVDVVSNIIQNQETITDENLCGRLQGIRDGLGNSVINPRDSNKKIEISGDIYAAFEKDSDNECQKISLTQARDIERLNLILDSSVSDEIKNAASVERYKILSGINVNVKGYSQFQSYSEKLNTNVALEGVGVRLYASEDSVKGTYDGGKSIGSYGDIEKDSSVQGIVYKNEEYLLVLGEGDRNEFGILSVHDSNGNKIEDESPLVLEIKGRFSSFIKYDRASYENPFLNPEVSYFETEPYKGSPAIVPFDTSKGWYAAIKQTLPGFGKIRAYDDSGRVASFWVCNVGENKRAEFNKGSAGIGDDICQQFNPAAGQIYGEFPALSESETRTLVSNAIRAIDQASRAYKPGLRGTIKILNEFIDVGKPAVDVPDFQCQDFMSPKDCLLLFNVCDPVVCPSSRCDLGGTYPVADVVQSGIVGSTLLCLPNAKEKIIVPICLSGVKAGMDGLISVQKNYQNCLQENLETGQTIGICDEIHSIYLCDFFWSQAAPLSEIAIPKIFEAIKGQGGTRGGGEYLGVQSAWKNAQNSIDFFSNYYSTNSFEAFKLRSVGSVGGAICNNFISASYPSNIDILAPQSPPQYTAWFEERAFTTATIPPTSQYKVFYHIFAGENIGAYYSVFLKSPEGTSFYQTNPILTVSRGFIGVGDFASETTDFTAPSGYKELCIRVNEQEECGFGKVTTSFALDYVQDKYLEEQAGKTDINSEKECVSGTRSAYSLLNPNLQAGASDVVDPALYNQGIVRICSTDQPGKGTDSTRWKQVGNCDNGKGDVKCWIDEDSVRDVIQSISLEDKTLEKINEDAQKLLKEGDFIEDFQGELDKITELDSQRKINKITESFIGKFILNIEKARLYLIRGDAYKDLINGLKSILEKSDDSEKDTAPITEKTTLSESPYTCVKATSTVLGVETMGPKYQRELGLEIIQKAKSLKVERGINDEDVKKDTGAERFECLVLQVSMQESCLSHCVYEEGKKDYSYCDQEKDNILKGDKGDSIGAMQLSFNTHNSAMTIKGLDIFNSEDNIEYGINYLIDNYDSSKVKYYQCANENYGGWKRALRFYNGWNTDCTKGDVDYIENILNREAYIKEIFPEECS